MPVYYRQDCGPTAASLMFCIVQEQLEFLIGLLCYLVQVSDINDNSSWMNVSRRLIVLEERGENVNRH